MLETGRPGPPFFFWPLQIEAQAVLHVAPRWFADRADALLSAHQPDHGRPRSTGGRDRRTIAGFVSNPVAGAAQ